jgi:CrcB protein
MARSLSRRRRFVAVLCGGFLGTLVRYALSALLQGWLGKGWPYDLLLINVTGSFQLAFVTTLAEETFLVGPTRRLFLNVGFLGAYTTFSSFALADVLLLQSARWLPALFYLLLSLPGAVLAVMLGDLLAQKLVSRARHPAQGARPSYRRGEALTGTRSPGTGNVRHADRQGHLLSPGSQEQGEARRKRGS